MSSKGYSEWLDTRFRVKSRRASNRGRELKVWRLVGKKAGNPPKDSLPGGILIDDYLDLKLVPAEAVTEEPRSCLLCEGVFPGCVGFCECFSEMGKGKAEGPAWPGAAGSGLLTKSQLRTRFPSFPNQV